MASKTVITTTPLRILKTIGATVRDIICYELKTLVMLVHTTEEINDTVDNSVCDITKNNKKKNCGQSSKVSFYFQIKLLKSNQ